MANLVGVAILWILLSVVLIILASVWDNWLEVLSILNKRPGTSAKEVFQELRKLREIAYSKQDLTNAKNVSQAG